MNVSQALDAELIDYSSWIAHFRHELYTPLNAIQGYSELLIEELEESVDLQDIQILSSQLHEISLKNKHLVSYIGRGLTIESLQDEFVIDENIAFEISNCAKHWVRARLQPLAQPLLEKCQNLKPLAPKSFRADVEKIEVAACLFQDLIQQSSVTMPLKFSTQKQQENISDFSPSLSDYRQEINCHSKNKDTEHKSDLSYKSHILIVDNNAVNRDLLSRYVQRQGHQKTEVSSGLEAIQAITSGSFDLVLLDVIMPEINGYQVLKWLRNSDWRYLPVIMISSLDEIDSVVKCIEMGAEDYLAKPFNPVLLKARVDACLEKKRLRDQETSYLDQLAQANHEITTLNQKLEQENTRLNAELEITQKLQQMILPKEKELAKIEDLEIAGFMTPAEEVGGDYYDVICYGDSIRIGIGDVTGHGLESGVLMLMVQTTIRTLIENGETEQNRILDVVNRTIFHNIKRMETDKNLTLMLVDYNEGRLKISGQHEEVLIFTQSGKINQISTVDLGFPIGLEEEILDFIDQTEVYIHPGDVIVLYTDGVTEAESKEGKLYGLERMCDRINQCRHQSALEIKDTVIKDLYDHIDNSKIYDDITLLVIKRKN